MSQCKRLLSVIYLPFDCWDADCHVKHQIQYGFLGKVKYLRAFRA
jgi:hypothetical protein